MFAEGYTPNWSEEIFAVRNQIKNTVPWTYVINDLNGQETIGTFYEKELQKTNHKEFRIERVIKSEDDKLYVKWKGYDSYLKAGLIKKICCDSIVHVLKTLVALQRIKVSKYFPKPFRSFERNINVKVDLSNYATKTDIKNTTHVDTSSLALKTNLANLKTEFDKLGIKKCSKQ